MKPIEFSLKVVTICELTAIADFHLVIPRRKDPELKKLESNEKILRRGGEWPGSGRQFEGEMTWTPKQRHFGVTCRTVEGLYKGVSKQASKLTPRHDTKSLC